MATILVVDDQPELRKFLCTLLARQGHRVLDTENGEGALAVCREVHPDLVVADLMMPGMDGYELVRRLRSEASVESTRIIFFTGLYEANEARSLAEQCGVHDVLRKPCSPAAILQAVDSALSKPPQTFISPNPGFDRQHARVLGDLLLRNAGELESVNSRLAASERQYREMFQGHPEPMWVLDAQSLAFLSVNDSAVSHYGYSSEEFLAKSMLDIVPSDDIPTVIATFQRNGYGPLSTPGVHRHYRNGRSLIEVELSAHKLHFGERPAFSIMVHDVTERNRSERHLRESESQLRMLASRLQQVREEERAFLARELHDDLGQSLTAMKMSLSWLAAHLAAPADTLGRRIASLIDMADQTLTSARRLASQLRPAVLDLGLKAAVDWQVEQFQYHSDIICEVELPPVDIPLTADQEVALFRIFQETLTNVARHSGATRVTTRITVENVQVTLAVSDNGRGIARGDTAKRSSLGLLGMRERVLSLGGSLEIEGTPGVGTLVRVSVPVTRHAQSSQAG